MPKFDGTGPNGAGPMTGRGFGSCCGKNGYGCGMGCGRRMECSCPHCPTYGRRMTKDEERSVLKEELEDVKAEAKAIEERLSDLE